MEQWKIDYIYAHSYLCAVLAIFVLAHLIWFSYHEFQRQKRKFNQFNVILLILISCQFGNFLNLALSPFLLSECEVERDGDNYYTYIPFVAGTIAYNIFMGLRIFAESYYIFIRSKGILEGRAKWQEKVLSICIWLIGLFLLLSVITSIVFCFLDTPEDELAQLFLSPQNTYALGGALVLLTDIYFLYLFGSTLRSLKILKRQSQLDQKMRVVGRYGIICMLLSMLCLILSVTANIVLSRDFYTSTLDVMLELSIWTIIMVMTGMKMKIDSLTVKSNDKKAVVSISNPDSSTSKTTGTLTKD